MKTTKTIWGSLIDSMKLLNSPIDLPNYVTLNHKYNIPDDADTDVSKWELSYFSIGLKPINFVDGGDHDSSDRDLYRPIPFIIKPITIDLTAVEESTYKIRVTKELNLVESHLCYLKNISNISFDNMVYSTKYNNISQAFSLEDFQTPITYTSPMVEDRCEEDKEFLAISTVIKLRLSKAEVDTLKDNALLLYGENDPELFEVALFGGIEDTTTKELSKTVAYLFKPITVYHFNADGDMLIDINIGTMVPK